MSIQFISKPVEKEIYLIVCVNDYVTRNVDFVGLVTGEYTRKGELFPTYDDIYEFDNELIDLDIDLFKTFKNLASAKKFVAKRNEFELMGNWSYDIKPYVIDTVVHAKTITGVYDTKTHMLIENECGNHYSSVLILAWIYLISEKLVTFEQYPDELTKVSDNLLNLDVFHYESFLEKIENISKVVLVHSYMPSIPSDLYPIVDTYIEKYLLFKESGFKDTDYKRKDNYKNFG